MNPQITSFMEVFIIKVMIFGSFWDVLVWLLNQHEQEKQHNNRTYLPTVA
jgi:hypothetical protein